MWRPEPGDSVSKRTLRWAVHMRQMEETRLPIFFTVNAVVLQDWWVAPKSVTKTISRMSWKTAILNRNILKHLLLTAENGGKWSLEV